MNKKMKLRYRAVLSLILSAVLFCMPAAAFSMNGNNAIAVRAEDSGESGTEEETEESATEQETSEPGSTEQETSEPRSTEQETEGESVSGNEAPELECTCGDKCGAYEYDRNCKVCVEDYRLCEIGRASCRERV